jgi:hypothetical protein
VNKQSGAEAPRRLRGTGPQTGNPAVRIAIVDSGINANHEHVGSIAGGIAITGDDLIDRLGHGTAIAGAIRERVREAELYAVKIFDRRLSTKFPILQRALEWCVENEMDVINLSVATNRPLPEIAPIIMSPSMVRPDPACPRDRYYYRDGFFYASPYPRPIPGVSVERNLQGESFAVANMTGFVARLLLEIPREAIRPVLIARAANNP